MDATLPLERMTKAEKISTMESLWADLCRDPEEVQSPAWHGQILRQREEAVRAGTEAVSDWRSAKKMIRDSVS